MLEQNKIYNEDCVAVMQKMEENSVDIVLTSPPYNTSRNTKSKNKKGIFPSNRYDEYDDAKTNFEYCEFIKSVFAGFKRVLKKDGIILWNASYGNENCDALFMSLNTIIESGFSIADVICWKKKCAMPDNLSQNKATRICEFVYVICRREEMKTFHANKEVVSVRRTGQKMYRPFYNFIEAANNDGSTELNKSTFSTELVSKLLGIYGKDKTIVFDPFMGTGTTAVGCLRNGFSYVGAELSKNQFDFSNKRIEEEQLQEELF